MKRLLRGALYTIGLLFVAAAGYAQPTLTTAKATSLTNIELTFGTTITAIPGGSAGFTISGGVTVTGASISGGKVELTVNPLSGTGYSCATCLTIAANTVTDAGGNNLVSNNNPIADAIPPTLTLTLPTTGGFVNTAKVTFTHSENLASGSITFTQTGGSADAGSPHVQALTLTELTANQTTHTLNNNPTLVDGAVYSVAYSGTDAAGNTSTTVTNTGVTFDVTPPTLTLSAPAASSIVNTTSVTYTLSETLLSGSITWTRASGTADAGSPHTQALTGTELSTPETGYTLTNNPTLVSGTVYNVAFAGTDLAGNAATTVTNSAVTFDNTPPTLTLTVPANNGFVNTAKVTYTRNENLFSGSITWTQTGGAADAGSPHVQALVAGELTTNETNYTLTNNPTTLVDGAIYTVTFNGTDLAGNAGTPVSRTNVTFDLTGPTFTLTQPATSSIVNTSKVTYTRSENLIAGTITWTRTGGTADGSSPHTQNLSGTELTADQTNHTLNSPPTLVSGAVYSVAITGTDLAGNTGSTTTNTTVTFDNTVPVLTLSLPAASTSVNNANVTYTISEPLSAGSITWTRTGGTADGASHVQALTGTELTTNQTNYTLTNNPTTLVSGTIYTVTFNGTDLAGNNAVTITKTNVTFDTTPPVLTLTLPANSDFVNNAKVTYTRSENLFSGTITFTQTSGSADGASPHVQTLVGGELSTNETNHTLTANPTLVNGAVYTVTFAGTDLAGNVGTPISNTNVTFDTSPPTILGTPCFHANGGSAETIDILFSETLGLADGTTVSVGGPGFTENAGHLSTAIYHAAGNKITLTATGNNKWAATDKIGYTSGAATPAVDLAGNEITTTSNVALASCDVPQIVSSMVLFPNGGAPEIISFEVDQQLSISSGTAVTGLSVSAGSIGTAIYTFASGVSTITLTSAANGQWTGTTTVSYNGSGNITTSAGSMATFSNEKILLTPVAIVSNNANTSWAKVGNTVTVSFTLNKPVIAIPTVTIDGVTATVVGSLLLAGTPYTAFITTTGADTEGPLAFDINVLETGRSTDITATLDGSSVTFDQTAPTVTPVTIISNNATNTAYAKPGDVVTVSYTPTDNLGTVSVTAATIDGFTATTSTTTSSTLTTTTSDNTGVMPFSITFSDQAGNTKTVIATTNASTVTFDKTPPTVTSINIIGGNLNGIGTSNGTSNTTLTYSVTFSENVTGVAPGDFTLTPSGFAGNGLYPLVGGVVTNVAGGPLVYTITATPITGTGVLRLDFNTSASVIDIAGNSNVAAFTTGQTYEEVLPQPANNVTALTASSPSFTSIKLDWTNPVSGQLPTHFLVLGKLTGTGSYASPSDGTLSSADANFNDANGGAAIVDLTAGYTPTSTITIGGLLSGQHYDFEVIPYTLSPNNTSDNVNYLTTATPTVSFVVTTSSADLILAGTTAAPATISSLATSFGAVNFSFKVQDDGGSGQDNAPTIFNQLIISAGGANTVTNWANVIASAELIDITGNPGSPITASAFGANSLTFTMPTGVGAQGYIADNATKEYQLKISLKTSLPVATDDQLFDFLVNNAGFTFTAASSTLAASQAQNTGAGFNEVTVVATGLAFTTQPSPTSIEVLIPFTIEPIVTAVDANGNTDLDFNSSVNVINTGTIPMNPGSTTSLPLTASSGVITFPGTFDYTDAGNGTLTVAGGGLTSASGAGSIACSAVTVTYSALTTITGGTGQATLSSLTNAAPGSPAFSFAINDDGGVVAGDGSFTRISQIIIRPSASNDAVFSNWTQIISGATLTDGTHTLTGTVNAANITFSAIPNTVGNLGHIADNATKNYTLNIWFNNSLGGTLPGTADDKKLGFSVTDSDITLNSLSSLFASPQTQTSGGGNGVFQVITTQLVFTPTVATATYLVNVLLSAQNPPIVIPVVKALDANNNVDLDYSAPVTTTNAGSLGMSAAPTTFVNGVISAGTFGAMKYTTTGDGSLTVTSTTPAANSLVPSAAVTPSGTISVQVGSTTSIGIGTAPATFSSVNTSSPVTAFSFPITDDGLAPPSDGNPTLISKIKITQNATSNSATLADWTQAISVATLTDGTNIATGTVNATDITFSGISFASGNLGYIGPNATKTYTLKIQLRTTLGGQLPITIDGKAFGFDIKGTNITTDPTGTQLAGAQSATSGTGNDVVTVVASVLNYLTTAATPPAAGPFAVVPSAPFPSSGTIDTPFGPPLGVEAVDSKGNRDLDFTSTITAFSSTTLTTSNNPSGPFTAGTIEFPVSFQYLTGNNITPDQLTMTAGGITTLSPPISIKFSTDSYVYSDPSYSYPSITKAATAIATSMPATADATIATMAQFVLSDGGAAVGTHSSPHADTDGAPTIISSITFALTGPTGDLNELALYDALGNRIGSQQATGTTVTFGPGLNITASDDGTAVFTIRASFTTTIGAIHDHDAIQFQISAVTPATGSQFYNPGGYIGGVLNGDKSGIDDIDVVTTQLTFIQQPVSPVGTFQPVPIPTTSSPVQIGAFDSHGNLDTDLGNGTYNSLVQLNLLGTPAAALQTSSFAFASGIVTIPAADPGGLIYKTPGDGTLTALVSGTLPPSVSTVSTAMSNHMDVYEVDATLATGITVPANLAGGSINKVIYGVTFRAPYITAIGPKLNSFVISFSNNISGVLKNARVKEQLNSTSYINGTDVTSGTINGKVTPLGSSSILVDFTQTGGIPRDFSIAPNTTYSYFLEVDVDGTASSSTPTVQPFVEDIGWNTTTNSFDPTNSNIVASPLNGVHQGGGLASKSNTSGQIYSFASIFPPTLISSVPNAGSINADPNGDIKLIFDVPVWSLNDTISLYQTTSPGAPGTFLSYLTLSGTAGQFSAANYTHVPPLNLADTLTFSLPAAKKPLLFNQLYYVTVQPATFNGPTASGNIGIIDQAGNKFAGISDPGAVYFRTSSGNPPIILPPGSPLLQVPSQIINISLTGATIQATFDQPGTAYFVLANHGSPAPTRAQIKSAFYASALYRDNFTISQTVPIAQYGIINWPLVNGQNYDVWMYATNNDLPIPVATNGTYGPSAASFATQPDGTGTSTFSFIASAPSSPGIYISQPSISICTGAYQPLNVPITIVEKNPTDLNGTGGGPQSFNLLLPPGFQFNTSAGGTVTLASGGDFASATGSVSFPSNSVVTINYTNSPSPGSHIDNLTISGLSVFASSPQSGSITKLGGTVSNSVIADNTVFANLSAGTSNGITFTNSQLGAVTFLPDQITVGNATKTAVQLIPSGFAPGDYGLSTFSGNGVTLDSLHLNAVTLGSPFNITITHTDNNGCVSQNAVQYLVYDHRKGLGLLQDYCVSPKYFPVSGPAYQTTYTVHFDNFPGFYLTALNTAIGVGGGQFLQLDTAANGPVVRRLPVKTGTGTDPANNPFPGTKYFDYNFYVKLLGDSTTWYQDTDYLRSIAGKNYFAGGSLGFIEFTGLYQSIANTTLSNVPLEQSAEFFAPPLLHIEVSGNLQNGAVFDPTGAGNIAPSDPVTPGYPGTFIFCQQGGTITFNGYPAAASTSVGTFSLFDYSSGSTGAQITTPVFVDNLAGTVQITNPADPTLAPYINKDLQVVYTYKDNNSPCKSYTYVIIRITSNPTASFIASSIIGPNTPTASGYCVGRQINFDASGSSILGTGNTKATYAWTFGDANSPDQNVTTALVNNTYRLAATFNVTLNVTSNWGCPSTTATTPVPVGNIPTAFFTMTGVSGTMNFTSQSTVVGGTDNIASNDWYYNYHTASPGAHDALGTFTYSPGQDSVKLISTSQLGCANSHIRPIVMLPRIVTSATATYVENFELDSGQWQHFSGKNSPVKASYNSTQDSWRWGTPNYSKKPDMQVLVDSNFVTATNKLWVTNLAGNDTTDEHSALYSPNFNISQLKRPMVSFNSFIELGSAGVVFEYSTDNLNVADSLKFWQPLGLIGTGVDWYNVQGLGVSPGDQLLNPLGWTDRAGVGTNWLESKHQLDALGAPSQVVFRFALATSAAAPPTEGFAMDNFRLGNRTRTVLVENFKNLGDASSSELTQAKSLAAFNTNKIGTELVKLNYDVGFPGTDPFNQDNPADPSARALYYNISSVPLARLDGIINEDPQPFSVWGATQYGLRSLQLSQATIAITPLDSIHIISPGDTVRIADTVAAHITAHNKFSFQVKVTPIAPLAANTILQVAILQDTLQATDLGSAKEKLIKSTETAFQYVVTKMLPSAAGTRFNTVYDSLHPPSPFLFEWVPDPKILYGATQKNLSIVAFLQDFDTKEVWQSAVAKNLNNPVPSVTTGIEPTADQITFYPNPADQQLTIQLPKAVATDLPIQFIDQVGRTLPAGVLAAGNQNKVISTAGFTPGMYIVQLGNGTGTGTRQKVIIIHNK